MNKAFIFPGQGSQMINMGKDFFDSEVVAKETFEEVDFIMGKKLSSIIFGDDLNLLSDTRNAQPAIMATSVAILRVLMHKSGKKIEELCSVVAGHSLGEYSAAYAANIMDLPQTVQMLKLRSSAMAQNCPQGVGAMAACIGIDEKELQQIIDENITEGICQIANYNSKGQIVISGNSENIDLVIAALKEKKYKAIKLNVSAAFHCDLMKPAEEIMAKALMLENFNCPLVPIISNYSAITETDVEMIRANLCKQISGSVKWTQTIDKFAEMGITELVEIGPGKVLTNLAKKSGHNFVLRNISNIAELDEYLAL